ncbi:MAG: FkbM family methyltransferase [Thalassobaculum sp.]|uniref:FkbM family methyltransferase n=1 Tax=Thalassobaculum sp. TaxID=2022740 RepID=UPI0032EE4E8A
MSDNQWIRLNNGENGLKPGEFAEVVVELLILRYTRWGEMAVDCGAADGRMVKVMLRAVGSEGNVVAFEPILHIFERLEEAFKKWRNVLVLRACVSDRVQDEIPFFYVKDRRWISSLSPDNLEAYDVEDIRVPVTTLDVALSDQFRGVRPRVSFIKLDIEGAEFSALRGAAGILARDQPFIVFENSLERAARAFGYDIEEFFQFFGDQRYKLYDVFGTPVSPAVWDRVGREVCWNFVAVHESDARLLGFRSEVHAVLANARKVMLGG